MKSLRIRLVATVPTMTPKTSRITKVSEAETIVSFQRIGQRWKDRLPILTKEPIRAILRAQIASDPAF